MKNIFINSFYAIFIIKDLKFVKTRFFKLKLILKIENIYI